MLTECMFVLHLKLSTIQFPTYGKIRVKFRHEPKGVNLEILY